MTGTEDLLEGLEPRALWEHFLAVSRIPRCSGNEEGVRRYVSGVAERHGCPWEADGTGNILVRKGPAPGMEAVPLVVIQSHMDMVCEKNRETGHDFARDPIRWRRDDAGWVRAEGTTLGADNGIGVAAQLALIESADLAHGPLELLFTADEETGLNGAMGLDPGLVRGRILLNLDSEEEGTIYIGCAGGQDTELRLPLETEPAPRGLLAALVQVGGLKGGHSGLEIHRDRGNAIVLAARFLVEGAARGLTIRVARLEGGDKRNAIPRECEALVYLRPADRQRLEEAVQGFEKTCRDELEDADPGVYVRLAEPGAGRDDAAVLAQGLQERLLDLLSCLPHGVIRMSRRIPGLVQTSTNLAAIRFRGREIVISTSQRSSAASELAWTSDRIAAAGRLAGARVYQGGRYPGWQPNLGSPVLGLARSAYRGLFGKEPRVTAIHAGLECGIIGGRIPGMDMISFGPTISGAHSPDEAVEIDSVKRFWALLLAILEQVGAPAARGRLEGG